MIWPSTRRGLTITAVISSGLTRSGRARHLIKDMCFRDPEHKVALIEYAIVGMRNPLVRPLAWAVES
jgi:hypothetical protein